MRVLMLLLLAAAVLFLAEAVTGIQSFHSSSSTGTVVTYARWHERLLALALAALHAVAYYGIYRRRYPVAWRLGFVAWYLAGALFVFQVWWSLWTEPYGWVGAAVATAFAPFVVLYWASWWRRQRPYFSAHPDEET